MKKNLLNEIITKITKSFRKCYNMIWSYLGIESNPLYNTNIIFIDNSFVDTDTKMDVLKLFVKKKTKQDAVYDLSKYKYIHSLNNTKNSYIDDSLFPGNLYHDILQNKHRYAVCIFDTDWIGNEKFDSMICELEFDDNNIFINSENEKIDDKSLIYLDTISGLIDMRITSHKDFFNELDKIL